MYICICWIKPYSTIFCFSLIMFFWMCKQISIYINISFQISYLFVFLLYCTKLCYVIVFVLVYHVIYCFSQLYCILFYGIYFLKVFFSWYLKNRIVFESYFTAFFPTENSGLNIAFWACVKTSIWMVFACRPLTAARLVQAGSDWALKLI